MGCVAVAKPVRYNTGCRLLGQQYHAYFVKHLLYIYRNKLFTLFQIALPIIILVGQFDLSRFGSGPVDFLSMDVAAQYAGSTAVCALLSSGSPSLDEQTKQLGQLYEARVSAAGLEAIEIRDKSLGPHLLTLAEANKRRYVAQYHVGLQINGSASLNRTTLTAYYNAEMLHSSAISMAVVYDVLSEFLLGKGHSIETISHPIPESTRKVIRRLNIISYNYLN